MLYVRNVIWHRGFEDGIWSLILWELIINEGSLERIQIGYKIVALTFIDVVGI